MIGTERYGNYVHDTLLEILLYWYRECLVSDAIYNVHKCVDVIVYSVSVSPRKNSLRSLFFDVLRHASALLFSC
jgi:hypothetical protein